MKYIGWRNEQTDGKILWIGSQEKKEEEEKTTWPLAVLKTLLLQKDFGTRGHSDRLTGLATMMGRKIGLKSREIADLRLFAQFHDLGKVHIPNEILFKQGPLTDKERGVMKMHSEIGARMASAIKEIRHLSDYIHDHHERWDGSGYPKGIKGLEIPLFCRILAIVDAWDAMMSDRPYRRKMSYVDAMAEIERCSGTQFDPTLVDIWRSL